MESAIFDWMQLLGRWAHIVIGIAWIGSSFFFMWLDRNLDRGDSNPENIEGHLWMVHSGGFYNVEKMQLEPHQVPKVLHWFKWEAAFTWITGVFLLTLIFYTGQGIYLLDEAVSQITYPKAVLLGIGSIAGSWLVYDFLWVYLGKRPLVANILSVFGLVAMAYLLSQYLSGRAAYIHVGAIMGTCMVANVWVRILPNQAKMIQNTLDGKPFAKELGLKSKQRSVHNNYMTLPVIFIMLSNHFPATYGHEMNWILLLLVCLAGACVRAFYNKKNWLPFIPAIIAVSVAFYMTLPDDQIVTDPEISVANDDKKETPGNTPQPDTGVRSVKGPVGAPGTIRGFVQFTGINPSRVELDLPAKCAKLHGNRKVFDNRILLRGSKVKNVVVSIKGPLPKIKHSVPRLPVVLDQKGCMYKPRTIAAQVGQEVIFKNSDPIFHNVKTIASANKGFNVGMPRKGMKKSKVFDKPEMVVQSKCSVHPWMGANIAVFDHPYFGVTNQAGEFFINQVPPGEYTIEAWHEAFGTKSKRIILTEGEQVLIDFEF